VEDVTGQQNFDVEEEEDVHQESGSSTWTKKQRENNQYKYHHTNGQKQHWHYRAYLKESRSFPDILGCVEK
jgi:hypothetical protein